MNLLIAEIEEDIKWRVSEISNIKTIPLRYSLLNEHKITLINNSIPSLYALWEGFLKSTFELLTVHINKKAMDYKDVNINILTHAIENKCNLGNERRHFKSKLNLVHALNHFYNSPFVIQQGIPTESNANYKVTNRILERFNIKPLDAKFEKPLDRLLLFRNKIAHGENSIKVNRFDVDEFSLLIQDLMYEILVKIEYLLDTKDYKNKTACNTAC